MRDKEIIERLGKFLEIKPDDESILNQFKSISKVFLGEKLNELAQTFVSRVTNAHSFYENFGFEKSELPMFRLIETNY